MQSQLAMDIFYWNTTLSTLIEYTLYVYNLIEYTLYVYTLIEYTLYIYTLIEYTLYVCTLIKCTQTNKQTNNNDLLEKDGGTKNCIYKD